MSGYIGNPDAESEHALILSENGIEAARSQLIQGIVQSVCTDCGEDIPSARQDFFKQRGLKCVFCVSCQQEHDRPAKQPRMLDRIL